jgi:hypothetical protein
MIERNENKILRLNFFIKEGRLIVISYRTFHSLEKSVLVNKRDFDYCFPIVLLAIQIGFELPRI